MSATPARRTCPTIGFAWTINWAYSIASRLDETRTPYKLNVGDMVRVESFTDPDLNRDT